MIEHLDTCTSTMDEARARARDGAPDGTVVVAKTMTGGRGQHKRPWHAPEGGLYMSIVLRGIDEPGLVTLALGNAVADVLEVAGAEPRLKWVNDVLVDDRKIAGVLVEAESTGEHLDYLVAGVGINVNGTTDDWPIALKGGATTLEEVLGADSCIEDLEGFMVEEIQRWMDLVRKGHRDQVLQAWRARDGLAGRTVRFATNGDDVDVEATVDGIDDDGHLIVDGRVFQTGRIVSWR